MPKIEGVDAADVDALAVNNNLSDVASVVASRSNLGLGSIAVQNANNVTISGGSISGITSLGVNGIATISNALYVGGATQQGVFRVKAATDKNIMVHDHSTSGTITLSASNENNIALVGLEVRASALTLLPDGGITEFNNGGAYVNSGVISVGRGNDSDGVELWLCHGGYLGAYTRYRNVKIGDGKAGLIAEFIGSTKATNLYGNLSATGTIDAGSWVGNEGDNSVQRSLVVGRFTGNLSNESGVTIFSYTDGNVFSDWKTKNNGLVIFRCGHNTETGSARTFMQVTASSGAVSMPSTLTIGGNLTVSDGELNVTDTSSVKAHLRFYGEVIGGNGGVHLDLMADPTGSSDVIMGAIKSEVTDGTPASEDATTTFHTMVAGTLTQRLSLNSGGTNITGPLGVTGLITANQGVALAGGHPGSYTANTAFIDAAGGSARHYSVGADAATRGTYLYQQCGVGAANLITSAYSDTSGRWVFSLGLNSTPIGQVTPAAGSFTTLTASGNTDFSNYTHKLGDYIGDTVATKHGVLFELLGDVNKDLFISFKAETGGKTNWRCGAGAETGGARIYQTVDNANGNITSKFNHTVSGGLFVTGSSNLPTIVMGGQTVNDILISTDGASVSNTALVTAGYVSSNAGKSQELGMAASDETTDLTTGTSKVTFRMPNAMTLTGVRASVTTAPTGSVLTVDINQGGISILSTKLTIDAGEKTSTTAATPAVISNSSLSNDSEVSIDIDGVGSTVAGTGLKIWLIGTRA